MVKFCHGLKDYLLAIPQAWTLADLLLCTKKKSNIAIFRGYYHCKSSELCKENTKQCHIITSFPPIFAEIFSGEYSFDENSMTKDKVKDSLSLKETRK